MIVTKQKTDVIVYMQNLILLFFILISNAINAQEMAYDFALFKRSLYQKKGEVLLMSDSLYQLYEKKDLSVYTGEGEVFHDEDEYIRGNEKVNIIYREDGRILYRFFRDSNIVQTGELVIDSNNFIIEVDYAYDTIYASDVVAEVYDTMYYLYPSGVWRIDHIPGVYEKGSYINGKKEGEWITYDHNIGHFPILSKIYKNDVLTKESKIGKVDETIVDENIVNTWKGIGYLHHSENRGLTFLLREGAPKVGRRMRNGQISLLNLEKNKKFNGQRYYSCGTGNYSGEYWNPKGKWKIIQEKEEFFLILKDIKYRIVYLTTDVMILD